MEMWIVWLVVALLSLIIEIFTLGFAVSCFAVGAAAAAIAASMELPITWQVILFSLFSIVALLTLRPLVVRYLDKKKGAGAVATNVDALVGRMATVSVEIRGGVGRATIDGDDWKVECVDRDEVVAVGERVEVIKVDSVILIVKRV
ncbi:MAG: NfeD family protein [Rikenellaceae bacterium]